MSLRILFAQIGSKLFIGWSFAPGNLQGSLEDQQWGFEAFF